MAIAYPTRKYKDLNLDLPVHPVTDDLVYLQDEAAVKRSIRNLVLTNFGERPFRPEFGSGVQQSLFEPLSMFTKITLEKAVSSIIEQNERRVRLVAVNATISSENNGYDLTINYELLNIKALDSVTVFLQRVR